MLGRSRIRAAISRNPKVDQTEGPSYNPPASAFDKNKESSDGENVDVVTVTISPEDESNKFDGLDLSNHPSVVEVVNDFLRQNELNQAAKDDNDVDDVVESRAKLMEYLFNLECEIYTFEESYLGESAPFGNIVKGYDKYREVEKFTPEMNAVPKGYDKFGSPIYHVKDSDRIFSRSSVGILPPDFAGMVALEDNPNMAVVMGLPTKSDDNSEAVVTEPGSSKNTPKTKQNNNLSLELGAIQRIPKNKNPPSNPRSSINKTKIQVVAPKAGSSKDSSAIDFVVKKPTALGLENIKKLNIVVKGLSDVGEEIKNKIGKESSSMAYVIETVLDAKPGSMNKTTFEKGITSEINVKQGAGNVIVKEEKPAIMLRQIVLGQKEFVVGEQNVAWCSSEVGENVKDGISKEVTSLVAPSINKMAAVASSSAQKNSDNQRKVGVKGLQTRNNLQMAATMGKNSIVKGPQAAILKLLNRRQGAKNTIQGNNPVLVARPKRNINAKHGVTCAHCVIEKNKHVLVAHESKAVAGKGKAAKGKRMNTSKQNIIIEEKKPAVVVLSNSGRPIKKPKMYGFELE